MNTTIHTKLSEFEIDFKIAHYQTKILILQQQFEQIRETIIRMMKNDAKEDDRLKHVEERIETLCQSTPKEANKLEKIKQEDRLIKLEELRNRILTKKLRIDDVIEVHSRLKAVNFQIHAFEKLLGILKEMKS